MFEPISTGSEILGTYNLSLVFLSYFIAAFASYTALDLAMRIGESHGKTKKFWIGGCAFAMGGGIWAMHFTGMLAFELPIGISYDVTMTIFSNFMNLEPKFRTKIDVDGAKIQHADRLNFYKKLCARCEVCCFLEILYIRLVMRR